MSATDALPDHALPHPPAPIAARQLRAPRWATRSATVRTPARCPQCGQDGTPLLAAELQTVWLIHTDTGVVATHFCRSCAPTGPVTDIACQRCEDGPLLTGALVGTTHHAAVTAWLRRHGWTHTAAGWTCHDCPPSTVRPSPQR